MTDISVTASNVTWVSGVRPQQGKAGVAITEGQAVYLDTTTNTYKLADANSATASVVAGVALTNAIAGRDFLFAPPGAKINVGATLTAGTKYQLSETAGGICPAADIGTGVYVNVIYIGAGTANATVIAALGDAVSA